MDTLIVERAKVWTASPYDEATRNEVLSMITKGGDELTDAFYKDLDFGTGGLRGITGAGSNRVNKYTLGLATQGLANYLKKQYPNTLIKVAIAYDCRNNSKEFSQEVASVLAGNGIHTYLFEDLRPTPELSYAIRHFNCHSGIMITASHNPPEYNGYKVYWNDGGQLVPPHDKAVIEEVRKVKVEDIITSQDSNLIEIIGKDVDKAFLQEVKKHSLSNVGKENLKIVFTPIHGTSITLMPQALADNGFTQVHLVEEQATPNGNFPTVVSPNPEEAEALDIAVKQAKSIDADIVIGTDPDADRVGIAVKNTDGKITFLNGNQAATLLIYFLLEQYKSNNKLTGNEYIAKTIVTSDLLGTIAKHYKVDCPNVLTGFKWIADIIRKNEDKHFIGGGEESYGYMIGDFVRDKDAISSAVLLCEAAAYAKAKGSSLYQMLIDIYVQFGYYQEALVSITKKGKKGADEITQMMENFRKNTPTEIGGEKVISLLDYSTDTRLNIHSGETQKIGLPNSNVLQFITDKGSKITARPSGTEPKIKFYFSLHTPLKSASDFPAKQAEILERIERMKVDLQ